MSRVQANMMLLVAAALWGLGNVAQKTVLDHVDALTAVGVRCAIAGILLAPLALIERKGPWASGWWSSLARVVVLFAVAMAIQQASYLGTTVTNASFLVNTATVMTPLAAWLLLRERPSRAVALAALMTLSGALLLSGGLSGRVSTGDAAAIASAAGYALWMIELGRHMQAFGRPLITAAAQFVGTALLILPLGAIYGNLSATAILAAGPEFIVLGVFSTAVAFGIQTAAQRFTSASHAAVIVSAESVFGAASAALFLGERISSLGAAGALLVLAAIAYLAAAEARAPPLAASVRSNEPARETPRAAGR